MFHLMPQSWHHWVPMTLAAVSCLFAVCFFGGLVGPLIVVGSAVGPGEPASHGIASQ